MSSKVRIRSAADLAGRDAAITALRELATNSGQVIIVEISLEAAGPVVLTRNHAGFECSHYFDYPARLADLTAALEADDESAAVRSEMCAATLMWMSDHGVPTSAGFEEFLRWAVFAELVFDDDGLALIGPASRPGSLPVGWHHQPGRLRSGADVIAVELERPHAVKVRDSTWLVMRSDGWTCIRIGSRGRTAELADVPTPPNFVTIRPSDGGERLDGWFLNNDVEGNALINFARDCPRPDDES